MERCIRWTFRSCSTTSLDALIAFERNGDPNHTGLPQWRTYDLTARATMLFDVECTLANDPRGGERRLFAQVPYIQRGTY